MARYSDVASGRSPGRASEQAYSYARWTRQQGHRWPAADSRHLGRLSDGSERTGSSIGHWGVKATGLRVGG